MHMVSCHTNFGNNMKTVLIVIPSLGIGGAEKSLIDLLNTFDYSKYSVDLLLLHSHGVLYDNINKNVNIIEGKPLEKALLDSVKTSTKYLFKNKYYLLATKRILASLIHRVKNKTALTEWELIESGYKTMQQKYDIAIAYLQGTAEYYVANKVLATKKVLWMHTSFKAHSNLNKKERKILLCFDKIMCVSSAAKEDFIKIIPEVKDNTEVFYNIIDRETILRKSIEKPDVLFDDNCFNIVSVGRLHYAKGYDISIKAFSEFVKEVPNARLYIVGDGPEYSNIKKLIKDFHIENSCILVGSTTNPYAYMNNADLILQASRYEGYCIALAEAKVLKKPILTTDFFGAREQIEDGGTGRIIECDERSIYRALRELYNNPKILEKYISNLENTSMNERDINEFLGSL